MGWRDDDSDAQNQGEANSPAQQVAEQHPEVSEIVVKGNHIWRALSMQGAAWWFGSNDTELLEHIMSMTGTVIVCAPGVDLCPLSGSQTTGQETLFTAFKEGTLTLRGLVKGSAPDSPTSVRVYRCNEHQMCLDPYPSVDAGYVGMEQILLDRLLGTTRGTGDGLIGRYASNTGSPTPQDLALLSNGGSYVSMAMNLAARSETSARLFVSDFSEVMAAELTAAIVDEVLASTIEASAQMDGGAMKEVQKLVARARRIMREDLKAFQSEAVANAEKFVYYKMLMDSMESPQIPAPAVSQH
jgi:conjugative transfer pilus assembly protein TraH